MASQPRYHFVPGATGPTIVGGDGCWLITDDGRRILDAAGGAMVVNIGHGRTVVADAVRDALDGGAYVVPIWSTPHRERLHDVLAERWLPAGMGNVFFTSGGSESADSAVRLARAHHVAAGRPERWKVVGRHPSYHGITLGAMAVGSHSARRAGYEPLLLDMPKVPWDDADAVVATIEREDPTTIAAFLFEPITGAAGACLMADRRVLAGRRGDLPAPRHPARRRRGDDRVRAHRAALGVTSTCRSSPDVLYGGKGLGGGYVPIGMVAATDDVVAPLRGSRFMYFTFTANDGACAGATAVLEVLDAEHLVERAESMGDKLAALLAAALGDHPHVVDAARARPVPWRRADPERRPT